MAFHQGPEPDYPCEHVRSYVLRRNTSEGRDPAPRQLLNTDSLFRSLQLLGFSADCRFVEEHRDCRYRIFKFLHNAMDHIAVRVSLPVAGPRAMIAERVANETRMLRRLREENFAWAPQLLGCHWWFDNPIQWPFVVVSWIEGSPMLWTDTHPAMSLRRPFLMDLYRIQEKLISATLETRPISSWHFFTDKIRRSQDRAPPTRAGFWPSKEDHFDQHRMLEVVLGRDCQRNLFAMAHNSIHPANVIVDEHYNIQGIIDWSDAEMMPICQASIIPRFLIPPVHHDNGPLGMENRDRADYMFLLNDANLVMTPSIDSLKRWQFGAESVFRALYITSIVDKAAHLYLVRNRWAPQWYPFYGNTRTLVMRQPMMHPARAPAPLPASVPAPAPAPAPAPEPIEYEPETKAGPTNTRYHE